jgi:hypothetical protein
MRQSGLGGSGIERGRMVRAGGRIDGNAADIRRLESCLSSAARIGVVGSWLSPGTGIRRGRLPHRSFADRRAQVRSVVVVPCGFGRLAGDAHRGELPGPVESRELRSVARVVLPLDTGALGDERGSDHVAVIPPRSPDTVDHVAGAARLVAAPELTVSGESVEEPLELHQVVGQAFHSGGYLDGRWQDRDRDRVLVDVHGEVDDRSRGREGGYRSRSNSGRR